jgi:hypothetical protein
MALYMISYDIDEDHKDKYQPLFDLLKKWGAEEVLFSQWVVMAPKASAQVMAEEIDGAISLTGTDRLLVQEVGKDAAWNNLKITDAKFIEWLKKASL